MAEDTSWEKSLFKKTGTLLDPNGKIKELVLVND